VTLLTATRDVEHSQAAVLAARLRRDGPDDDRPGDPACLLRRVCPKCGSVADADPPTTCPNCHTSIP
jgi:rubrerythrin